MLTRTTRNLRSPRRGGLAPLEMVLHLPWLLFVMALIINVGTAASWKVRAAMVARSTVWNNRWPRWGASPQPANWPQNATQGTQAGNSLQVLADPSIDQPVARGPMLGQTTVNRNLLDPTLGLQIGTSSIQRPMPLLPAALPNIHPSLQHDLLDNGWQYQRMGMASNQQLREPIIYQFAQASQQLMQDYVNSVVQVWFAPFQPQLAVLDKDQEILAFYGSYHDFHPRIAGFCSLNTQQVHKNNVLPLIDRIQGRKKPHVAGVPETMSRFFINMYQAELRQPGLDPAQMAQIQSKIQALQQFLGSL